MKYDFDFRRFMLFIQKKKVEKKRRGGEKEAKEPTGRFFPTTLRSPAPSQVCTCLIRSLFQDSVASIVRVFKIFLPRAIPRAQSRTS